MHVTVCLGQIGASQSVSSSIPRHFSILGGIGYIVLFGTKVDKPTKLEPRRLADLEKWLQLQVD